MAAARPAAAAVGDAASRARRRGGAGVGAVPSGAERVSTPGPSGGASLGGVELIAARYRRVLALGSRAVRSLSLAACLVALALPSGALAQTPGDDQYTDPFGGSQDEGSGGQPEDDGDEAPPPAATPAPAAPETSAPPAEPAEAAPAQATEQLPYTGADAGLLAAGGATLLVGGVMLRLRLRLR